MRHDVNAVSMAAASAEGDVMSLHPQRWPQVMIMATGCLLILSGLAAIIFQVLQEASSHIPIAQSVKGISVSPEALSASTRFVGVELILVGALLEIVGYAGTRPWKNSD